MTDTVYWFTVNRNFSLVKQAIHSWGSAPNSEVFKGIRDNDKLPLSSLVRKALSVPLPSHNAQTAPSSPQHRTTLTQSRVCVTETHITVYRSPLKSKGDTINSLNHTILDQDNVTLPEIITKFLYHLQYIVPALIIVVD